jgi:D-hydroxyproline dehydrogenase subunit beta
VLVIGAGVSGILTCVELSLAGLSTILVDSRGGVGCGTTAGSGGSLSLQDKADLTMVTLAKRSFGHYDEILTILDVPEIKVWCGGVVPFLDDRGRSLALKQAAVIQQAGVAVEEVDGNTLREACRYLTNGVLGGVVCNEEGRIDPVALCFAGLRFLLRLPPNKFEFVPFCEIIELRWMPGFGASSWKARSSTMDVACSTVVNAAGAWSGKVAQLAGVELPCLPRRGYIVSIEPPGDMDKVMHSSEYVGIRSSSLSGKEAISFAFEQRHGFWRIGSSREFVGFVAGMDAAITDTIIHEASRFLTALSRDRVRQVSVCFRPYSGIGRPMVGPHPDSPTLISISGQEGDGIGLAAIFAKLAQQSIVQGRLPADHEWLAPPRTLRG